MKDLTKNKKANNIKFDNKEISKIVEFQKNKDSAILAILFTDIVGYSSLVNKVGDDEAFKIITYYENIMYQIINEDNSGIIIKKIGDSFLSVFIEPSKAVAAALKFQKHLSEDKKIKNIIKCRIGIHLGQVIFDNNFVADIFGDHVNIAARIMNLSKGNQILVSKSIYENVVSWLKKSKNLDKYSFNYFFRTKLKGIKDRYDLYEIFNSNLSAFGKSQKIKYQLFVNSIFKLFPFIVALFIFLIIFYNKPNSYSESSNNDESQIMFQGIDSDYNNIKFIQDFLIDNSLFPVFGVNIDMSGYKADTLNTSFINSKLNNKLNKMFHANHNLLNYDSYSELFYKNNKLVPESYLSHPGLPLFTDVMQMQMLDNINQKDSPLDSVKSKMMKQLADSLNISHIFKFGIYKLTKDDDEKFLLEYSYLLKPNSQDSTKAKMQAGMHITAGIADIIPYIESTLYELVYPDFEFSGIIKQVSKEKDTDNICDINDDCNILIDNIDTSITIPKNTIMQIHRGYFGDIGIKERIRDIKTYLDFCNLQNNDSLCNSMRDYTDKRYGNYLFTKEELEDLLNDKHKYWMKFDNDTLMGMFYLPGYVQIIESSKNGAVGKFIGPFIDPFIPKKDDGISAD